MSPTLGLVTARREDQRIDDAQRLVHSALESAMRIKGLRTARALSQALNDEGYSVGERTVTGWRSRESAIPAWALVALKELTGIGLDALLGLEDTAGLAERLARQERQIGEIQAILIDVCERVGVSWRPEQQTPGDRSQAVS